MNWDVQLTATVGNGVRELVDNNMRIAEELATIVASNRVTIARDSAPPPLLLSFLFCVSSC